MNPIISPEKLAILEKVGSQDIQALCATIRSMQQEINELRIAEEICNSEEMMWLIAGANHADAHLATLREFWPQWKAVGGGYGGKRAKAAWSACSLSTIKDDRGLPRRTTSKDGRDHMPRAHDDS